MQKPNSIIVLLYIQMLKERIKQQWITLPQNVLKPQDKRVFPLGSVVFFSLRYSWNTCLATFADLSVFLTPLFYKSPQQGKVVIDNDDRLKEETNEEKFNGLTKVFVRFKLYMCNYLVTLTSNIKKKFYCIVVAFNT